MARVGVVKRQPVPVRNGSHAVDPATLPWPDNVVRAALPHDWQVSPLYFFIIDSSFAFFFINE